jgi:hypothetical protein
VTGGDGIQTHGHKFIVPFNEAPSITPSIEEGERRKNKEEREEQ